MTESQKALGQIIVFVNKHGHQKDKEEMAKPIGVIKCLVDKSIPMKPKELSISHEGRLGNCPNCNKVVWEFRDPQYHTDKECLQMLDWSRP